MQDERRRAGPAARGCGPHRSNRGSRRRNRNRSEPTRRQRRTQSVAAESAVTTYDFSRYPRISECVIESSAVRCVVGRYFGLFGCLHCRLQLPRRRMRIWNRKGSPYTDRMSCELYGLSTDPEKVCLTTSILAVWFALLIEPGTGASSAMTMPAFRTICATSV